MYARGGWPLILVTLFVFWVLVGLLVWRLLPALIELPVSIMSVLT